MFNDKGGSDWTLLPLTDLPHESNLSKLLGAVVQTFDNPLDQFEPDGVDAITKDFEITQTTNNDFTMMFSETHTLSLLAKIGTILGLNFSEDWTISSQLTSPTVDTHSLVHHDRVFKKLMECKDRSERISQMVNKAPHHHSVGVFMVVGIKICKDAKIQAKRVRNQKGGATIDIPLKSFPAVAALPVNIDPNVEGDVAKNGTIDDTETATGGRILALKYMKIHKTMDGKIEMGGVFQAPAGKGLSEV